MSQPRTIPLPSDACPPAADQEAILLWLYGQHLRSGRIERHKKHSDPFWRRVDEKQRERRRLADEIALDEDLAGRIVQLAVLFDVEIAGLSHDEQIAAVVRACVPLRFLIAAELEDLGQPARAAEVLRSVY